VTAPTPPALNERIAQAVRSNAVMFPLIGAVGFAANIAVARSLSTALFALYAAAVAVRGTLQFLADLGTGQASSRAFADLERFGGRASAWRLYRQLALVRAGFVIVLALLVLAAPDAARALFGLDEDEHYFLYFVVLVGAAEIAGGLGHYVLIGTLDQPRLNRVLAAQAIVQPTIVLAAAAAGAGLPGILAGVLAGSLVRGVVMNVLAVRRIRRFDQSSASLEGVARVYSQVAIASVVGKVASWVHSRQILTIVALSTTSRADVAVFALAYDFATQIITYTASPASGVALPALTVSRADPVASARIFGMTVRGLALLLLPVAATLTALSPVAIPAIFGDEYRDAVPFALVFFPGMAVEFTLTAAATGYMLAHDDLLRPYTRIKLVTTFVAALYALALGADLFVVALVMMAARVGSTVALHVAIHRARGFGPDARWLVRCAAAAAGGGLAAVVPLAVIEPTWVELAVAAAVSLAVFAALARVLGVVSPLDVSTARRLHPLAGRLAQKLLRESP
jgi:O-antigen/teichoic acid export membrane protein